MATLQLELSSSLKSESNTDSLASLQESLLKALDSIVEKDETNKSLLIELKSLRDELSMMRIDIRKKDKENNSLTKRLNKALDKILDLQSQGKLDKKERYGKSSLKGIRASKSESRDRDQEKDDYDGSNSK